MGTSKQDYTVKTVDSLADLHAFEEPLARLLASNPNHTPFQSLEWCGLCWIHLAPGNHQLRVFLILDRNGISRGAAPMFIEPGSSFRPATLKNLSSVLGDYGDILVEPGHEEPVSKALLSRLNAENSEWSAFEFNRLTESSPFLAFSTDGMDGKKKSLPVEFAPTHRVSLPGSFDEFLASLDTKFRSNYRRRKSRICADHEIVFKSVDNEEELHGVVDSFITYQKARFAEQYKYGFFKNKARETFFREAAVKFLENGWLDLHYFSVDGRLGAAQFALELNGTRYNYQIVMDPELRKHSPGTLLMMSTIEKSIEHGIKIYDLLSGEYDYKQTLCADSFPRFNWHSTQRPLGSWANHWLSDLREDLESRLWVRRWAFKLRGMTSL